MNGLDDAPRGHLTRIKELAEDLLEFGQYLTQSEFEVLNMLRSDAEAAAGKSESEPR